MTVKYKTVITKAGAEKLAAATVPNGKKVNFTAMAVGDGGGKLPEPNASQTKLVNEVWRHALNKISQDKKHKNYVVAELVIPPETGGFWLREMGLYDDTGTLIAVGNMAESYKPELAEGSGRAQTLRMVIMVSDIDTVELSIDTTLVMATQDYVDDKLAEHEQSRRHPDATLKEKGFTQLSNATDSTSETLAATPKAVKAAYDLADGKYTAQDATTKQKGIVQLSSATDSTSEALAATPKAVKAVNDELTSVKERLGTASKADVVTSLTDTTAGRVPVVGWQGLGGAARNVTAAKETVASFWRDAVEVKSGITIPYDGTPTTNYFAIDGDNHHAYIGRQRAGAGISWVKLYSEYNKPKAADVDAVSASLGGTFARPVTFNQGFTSKGRIVWGDYANAVGSSTYNGMVNVYDSNGKMRWAFGPYQNGWSIYNYDAAGGYVGNLLNIDYTSKKATFAGAIYSLSEIQSSSVNSYRIAYGNYGTFWRNDGSNLYLMLTNSGDVWGSYGSLRPFTVSLATGRVSIGHGLNVVGQALPSDYGNFDARYQAKGSYAAPNTASRGANGWLQDASTGLIYQWCQGATVSNEANHTVTFPKAFPSACLFASVSTLNVSNNDNAEQHYHLVSKTTANCVVKPNRAYGSNGSVAPLVWAVGY
ncbi:phage-related tail fiber protein [Lelliottia sp. 489]|uniref:phage tail protein n=1 Tax=Lelliottia sp. 489 TaxID=3156448 RepID=UPI003D1CA8A1